MKRVLSEHALGILLGAVTAFVVVYLIVYW
jgi:hypothetical protein